VKDAVEAPVGTTHVCPAPADENVTEHVVPTHEGVGDADAGAPEARTATPRDPATGITMTKIRPTVRGNLGFTLLTLIR
jgi:hypothetical protein